MKKINLKRIVGALLLLAILTLSLSLCACKYKQNDSRIIAKVGEHEISVDMFNYFYMSYLDDDETLEKDEAVKLTFEAISKIEATYDLAAKYGVELSKDEISELKEEVKSYKDQFEDEETFYSTLSDFNLTEQMYFDLLSYYSLQEDLYAFMTDEYTGDILSDDKTVIDYVKENFYVAAQILIRNDEGDSTDDNKALAETLLKRINEGEDFFTLAKKYSEDADQASYTTGYYFAEGMLLEFFEEEVFKLEIGQMSGIVESYLGYHIIYRLPIDDDYLDTDLDTVRETYLEKMFDNRLMEIANSYEIETIDDVFNEVTANEG